MRKPLERTIVTSIIATAKRLGWWACKIHGSAYQLAGLPDVLCIKDGMAVWIEAKRPGQGPSPIQERRMSELSAAGCRCFVATSAAQAAEFLEAA